MALQAAEGVPETLLNVLSAACFMGFVLLGLAVAAAERTAPGARRRAVLLNAFLLYCVAASFGAGLTQRDAWPFSRWNFADGLAAPNVTTVRIVALDAGGVERGLDARAWQPLGFDELNPWMLLTFPRLTGEDRDRVAAHLLDLAEDSRRRARAGGRVGSSLLGPLAAPSFDLHPRLWSERAAVPPEPFVGLRVYREEWNQEERLRDDRAIRRSLLHEYRPR